MKKIFLGVILVLCYSSFFAVVKTAYIPFKIDVPSGISKVTQSVNAIFSAEIKNRNEFDVVLPESLTDMKKKKPDLFTGLSGIQEDLRSAALAGADYLLTGNITYKDQKIIIDVNMIDTLTGRDEWDDEVWTADTATDKGLINAVKVMLERLVRKMGGQSVSAYSELGETKTTEGGYQVKLNIFPLQKKKPGEKYRYELVPYGEVADSTNIIVAGMKDYSLLVYNDSRSGMLVYSNSIMMDENKEIKPVDDTIELDIKEISNKRPGDTYRLVVEPYGDASENSMINIFSNQNYTFLLYNQSKSNLIAYSNNAVFSNNGTIKIFDNSVDITIPSFGYKEEGAVYRLEVTPFGTVGENTNITVQYGLPYTFKLYNETRDNKVVYSRTFAFKENTGLDLTDRAWGKFFNVRLFTGMGMLGSGFELFFSRRVSTFIGASGTMLTLINPQFSISDLMVTPMMDINFYILDINYLFRLSAGLTGYINYYFSPSAAHILTMDSYGVGLQAGIELYFLFIKAGMAYSLMPDQKLSPFVQLGVRF